MSSRLMRPVWHTKLPSGILCQVANTSAALSLGVMTRQSHGILTFRRHVHDELRELVGVTRAFGFVCHASNIVP